MRTYCTNIVVAILMTTLSVGCTRSSAPGLSAPTGGKKAPSVPAAGAAPATPAVTPKQTDAAVAAEPAVSAAPITCRMTVQASLPAELGVRAAEPYVSGTKAARAVAAGGRTKTRLLYSFEDSETHAIDGKPIPYLSKAADDVDIVYVQDNGATHGTWCARATVEAGKPWGGVIIRDKEFLKGWSEYDYFAMDVFIDDDHPYGISFELWDELSINYPTRCTFDGTRTRRGQQTLMWPIARAKRNNKEGREWHELEPTDKIDQDNLKCIKIFTTPRKDRRMQFWIDNVRLLQKDAAKPKMHVDLPATAKAFDFGSPAACVPGFTPSPPGESKGKGLVQAGKGWPDLLTGTFMSAAHNERMTWSSGADNGKYYYWLCAGKILPDQYKKPQYLLKLNGIVLADAQPSFAEYDSADYVHRFIDTQYSERPHAAWLDYVDRMYPVHSGTVTVDGGAIRIEAVNHFVSALILVPEADKADFERMQARLTKARVEMFERLTHSKAEPRNIPSQASCAVFVPEPGAAITPDSPAGQAISASEGLKAAGAQGQNVFLRLAVRAAGDLGTCELQVSDLKGSAGSIPGTAFEGFLKNYRFGDRGANEMVLLPTLGFHGEHGITQSLWLWLTIPEDAAAGLYRGSFNLRTERAGDTPVPVVIDVYPFKLRGDMPISYGMYGGMEGKPKPPTDFWNGMAQRYAWMKKAGFTGTSLPVRGTVRSVNADAGTVTMTFSKEGVETLRASGLGAFPEQYHMTTQLGIARAISRKLQPAKDSTGAPVDKNPGVEFTHPRFKACWFDALTKWRTFLNGLTLPYAIEIVDEPREVSNPWNRNLKYTRFYGDWMKEVGFTTRFVTPMSDGSGGKDYTGLSYHTDIMSIHAGKGSKGQEATAKAKGIDLWYYNTSKDRFGWGFFPWARGVTGRWEWHWMWSDSTGVGGYPGRESYSPFSGQNGYTIPAPWADGRGGFLFKTHMAHIADGITDRAYLHTVEELIKAKPNTPAAVKAKELLASIKEGVPPYPHNDAYHKAAHHADEWRAKLAAAIIELEECLNARQRLSEAPDQMHDPLPISFRL